MRGALNRGHLKIPVRYLDQTCQIDEHEHTRYTTYVILHRL